MKTNILKVAISASMFFCMVSCDDVKDLVQVSSNIQMPLSTGSCADAEFLAESRAWDVVSSDPTFENVGRIELTASGNYMFLPNISNLAFDDITEDDYDYMPSPLKASKNQTSPFRKTKRKQYPEYDYSYPFGTFEKVSENEYTLSGLGKLIVNSDRTLTLEKNGSSYDFNATPVEAYQLDELTRRFSRTWEVVQVERGYYNSDGKLVDKRILEPEEVEYYYVKAVVVTQYGAFVRYEWDNSMEDYGLWKWEIPEKQFFQFAFSDGWNNSDSALEQVFFYNDFAMYIESSWEENEEYLDGQYYDVVDVLKTKSVNRPSL